jgi:NADPH:quinone reductase-like Zn-dependent oxidoreductase
MKAVVYKKYGSPNVFELLELEKPTPEPGEVLIRVFASTVTAADCMMRRGDTVLSRILLGLIKPGNKYQILGTEFSGQNQKLTHSRRTVLMFP